MKICGVPGCEKEHFGNGLCLMHYTRIRRHGVLNPPKPVRTGRPRRPPEVRFWEMVDKKAPNGCWLWTGSPNTKRYPNFTVDTGNHEKTISAHRFAYILLVGAIPKGMQIDHLCRNTRCVNPAHMEVVTGRVNVLRGNTIVAINAAKTFCDRGHPLTPENVRMENGSRRCKVCRREDARARRLKNQEPPLLEALFSLGRFL